MLSFIRHYLAKYLLVWLSLVCLLAFYWPRLFGAGPETFDPFIVSKMTMQIWIAVTMLAIGSLLPIEEVRQVARRWTKILDGTCIQYISMPFLAWFFATIFKLEGGYFLGVIMAGCVPGAMASNMLTMIARGNVSYSVGLTTSATLLSPIVVPLTLSLLVGKRVSLDVTDISLTLLLTVVLPVVIGFSLSRLFNWWHNAAQALGEIIANIVIILIIASVVAGSRDLFKDLPFLPILTLLCLNIFGLTAGYFGGRIVGVDSGMRRALMLEVGMQNAGLGTFLARQYFPESPEAALCCALYTFGCMFTGIIVAQIFKEIKNNDSPSPLL